MNLFVWFYGFIVWRPTFGVIHKGYPLKAILFNGISKNFYAEFSFCWTDNPPLSSPQKNANYHSNNEILSQTMSFNTQNSIKIFHLFNVNPCHRSVRQRLLFFLICIQSVFIVSLFWYNYPDKSVCLDSSAHPHQILKLKSP